MQAPTPASLAPLLWLTAFALAAGAVVVVAWAARGRARTGRVLHETRRRRGARAAWIVVLLVVAALVLLSGDAIERPPALAVLALAAFHALASPGPLDSRYGELGVQLGWHARRYEELEEWRLTGDHLRWKLRGLWVACDVPARFHDELRAKLERLCPERASRFAR